MFKLDALVNDFFDLPIEPSDWLAGEPKMDNWMDNSGAAADCMGPDQVFSCPRKDSNLRTRFRKPMLYPLSYGAGRERLAARPAGSRAARAEPAMPGQAEQCLQRAAREHCRQIVARTMNAPKNTKQATSWPVYEYRFDHSVRVPPAQAERLEHVERERQLAGARDGVQQPRPSGVRQEAQSEDGQATSPSPR